MKVHCHVGSLEMILNNHNHLILVHCHVGSLEIQIWEA